MNRGNVRRTYPRMPLVGVAGVIVQKGKVLIIQRGKAPGKGEWNIPGGLVEVGETLEEAVAREVREETGLAVEVGELLQVADRIIRDEKGQVKYHYVLLDYLCTVTGGVLTPASDAADARWLSLEELDTPPLPDPVREVLARVEKVTAGHKRKEKKI